MIRLDDVPMRLLRSFAVSQKYGIRGVSTRDKASLLQALKEADEHAEEKFPAWLAERNCTSNEKIEIESLPNGRRFVSTRNNVARIYKEVREKRWC